MTWFPAAIIYNEPLSIILVLSYLTLIKTCNCNKTCESMTMYDLSFWYYLLTHCVVTLDKLVYFFLRQDFPFWRRLVFNIDIIFRLITQLRIPIFTLQERRLVTVWNSIMEHDGVTSMFTQFTVDELNRPFHNVY